jgi:hypothetical protein
MTNIQTQNDSIVDIQNEITAYLLATYELDRLDAFLQSHINGFEYTGIDNPITWCLAESSYFIPALQDAYTIKKVQQKELNADFSKKLNQFLESKPVQKPVTKNSVVCSIAAKLSSKGVKKPLTIAWKLYRVAMNCLNAIAQKCYLDFYGFACQLEYILLQHRFTDISQLLPPSVCHVFRKHALSLTI